MALRWSTTDKAGLSHGVKVLVYGPAGVGKTVLCTTAPAPVILSAEAGLLSLRRASIPVIEIATIDDLSEAHRWASSSQEAAQFATICLDSLSEIGEVVLANAKKQVKDPRQAYGELIEKMGMLIRAFRDLSGKHVYMSAKQEAMKDEMANTTKYNPSMPGAKLSQQLGYFFDEVFRLGIGKTPEGQLYRFLQTQPDLQYEAKDRSGCLAPLEAPDLNAIFTKIQNT
jgi:hypothetical protein